MQLGERIFEAKTNPKNIDMISGGQKKRRVGVVGFGHLGQFLVGEILRRDDLELTFVWNRTISLLEGQVDDKYILKDLHCFKERTPELIIEVAHPSITAEYGESFLDVADYMIGSPTAFANSDVENKLRKKASSGRHGIYIPSGALWGGSDIKKMADRETLQLPRMSMMMLYCVTRCSVCCSSQHSGPSLEVFAAASLQGQLVSISDTSLLCLSHNSRVDSVSLHMRVVCIERNVPVSTALLILIHWLGLGFRVPKAPPTKQGPAI
ncbi:aspartate dehydrogenase domain-containing protein-like [Montipora foliosa]|uniref:aspartate dehydrogenase domain-containing protein-like n=1 Tax=Montipora foliosa TaxID=591990 RepID=UPI0035F1F99B